MKYNLIINSIKASIKVTADNSDILRRIKKEPFLYQYIPKCNLKNLSIRQVDCELVIKESGKFKVEFNYPSIYCFQPENVDAKGLISLIGYILDRANAEKEIYSIHGSAISKNKKAVILFGGTTNLGKTTVARQIIDMPNWRFNYDEFIMLDSVALKIVGGSNIVSSLDNPKGFELPETKNSLKISAFVHPHIDNGLNKIIKWGSDIFLWHLKEELARKIRGGSKAINFFSYPLPSLDTPPISKKRLNFVKKLTKKISCYEIRGSPQYIADSIDKFNL